MSEHILNSHDLRGSISIDITRRNLILITVRDYGLGWCVVSSNKKLCFTFSLFTQVYKWVTYYWGLPCNGLASYLGGEAGGSLLKGGGGGEFNMVFPKSLLPTKSVIFVNNISFFLMLYCTTNYI